MISLGCAKNLVDAETMLGETLDEEFSLALDPAEADVIVVNTCGFIQDARDEARQTIRECLAVKAASRGRIKVAAAGCWTQRSPDDVLREFPELDAVWGLGIPSSLRDAIRALAGAPSVGGMDLPARPRDGARLLTTLPSFAYLRISDGCDNRCNYCAIPLIRGGLRSLEPDRVVEEAVVLEGQGARELVVISQDTTAYGKDLQTPGATLADLLERLLAAVKVPRIRILYAHPAHIDDRVMDLLAGEPRLCRYLDLPIQHIADNVLRLMGRGYGRERVLEVADRLAAAGVTLRTTILTGFPGETEEDFREVLDFVESGCFHQLGAFAYSPEPGTPAAGMDGAVPPEIAARRRDAVLQAQSAIAFAWLDSRVGGTEEVLVDSRPGGGWLVGRTTREAPDADGAVYLEGGAAQPGDLVSACIKRRDGYDLLAETTVPGGKRNRGRRKNRKR